MAPHRTQGSDADRRGGRLPFIGRALELAEVGVLLDTPDVRLVTLIGPGGVGKSRLAAHLARSPRWRELLLLDDAERHRHEMPALTALLATSPTQQVLATSRTPLGLIGEQLYELGGLGTPPAVSGSSARPSPDGAPAYGSHDGHDSYDGHDSHDGYHNYDSVALFLQCARRHAPTFEPTAANLSAVVRICRLLRGLPLGLMLAAARLEQLGVKELADELALEPDLLAAELPSLPPRQRSLRAVIDASWQLLSEVDRDALTRLAALPDGFSRDDAARVAGVGLRSLLALIDSSLLQRRADGRFERHPAVLAYSQRKRVTAQQAHTP